MLATANAAGYRYGVSDQAFYIPVVERALNPAAFPRDAALIDAQGHLMLADEAIAAIVRTTGLPLDVLFFALYLLSLALIWIGLVLIGTRIYVTPWATLALGAAFTMRHRIARTSANTFEPYFHPRMLAFGICLLAVAAVLRRRPWIAIALVGIGAAVHITTAMWFAVMLGVAILVLEPAFRRLARAGAIVVAVIGLWAVTAGPLHTPATRMDDLWLAAVASKDSLFASDWPWWAWMTNLMLAPVLWLAVRRWPPRSMLEMHAIAWGATALVLLFLATLPPVLMHYAFPTQLQISRVFWLVDLVATLAVIGALVDRAAFGTRAARAIAALLVAVSLIRGVYILTIEHPERSLFSIHLDASPWHDAMRWLRERSIGIHVLADPGHAWKYGTSVRVSAARDVFLEQVKDSAIAIYSRDVAARVVERDRAVADFSALTAADATALAERYQLDYLVIDRDLDLPLVYRNAQFRIYRLW